MTVEIAHLVATAFMAGLIVFVQIVHYPLMALVGEERFERYELAHTSRTGWVVIPPMLTELATAVWLVALPSPNTPRDLAGAGLLILAVVWLATATIQAPAHGRLAHGFDAGIHRRLVRSNWIRTAGWLARVPIAIALLP